jgi:hypothetical protein
MRTGNLSWWRIARGTFLACSGQDGPYIAVAGSRGEWTLAVAGDMTTYPTQQDALDAGYRAYQEHYEGAAL